MRLWMHGAHSVWIFKPEPCGGDDLRGVAAVLGLAAGAAGWVVVECGVSCRVGGDAVADGAVGGRRRGGGVVVDEGNVGRCGDETSTPPEGAGGCRTDCRCCGLVDVAEDVP